MAKKYNDNLKLMVLREYQIFRPVGKVGDENLAAVRLETRKGI